VITLPGMGLITMKPAGSDPAETFQGLWAGTGTERRFALGCGLAPGQLLAPAQAAGDPAEFRGGREWELSTSCSSERGESALITHVQSTWTSSRVRPLLGGQRVAGDGRAEVWFGHAGVREGAAARGEQPRSAKWPYTERQRRPGSGGPRSSPAPPAAFLWPSWPRGPFTGAAGACLLLPAPLHWHPAPRRAGASRPGRGREALNKRASQLLAAAPALF